MKTLKKFYFIFILLVCCLFYLVACSEEKPAFTIEIENSIFQVGQDTFVTISSDIEVEWASSDKSIAVVDEYGVITFKAAGTVTITATNVNDPSQTNSVEITVVNSSVTNIIINGDKTGSVGETLTFTYKLEPKKCESEVLWETENSDLVDINQNGEIKLLAEGIATIKVTALDDLAFSTTFQIGIFDYSKIIVDQGMTYEIGETVTYEGKNYYAGFTYVTTIKEAIDAADENATIYVLKGTYSETINIKKNGLKIYGVNHKDGSFDAGSVNDTVIEKVFVIGTDVKDVEVKGLTFVKEAVILLYGNNENLLIANNKFLSLDKGEDTWYSYKGDACIKFVADDKESNDITIINNYFKDIKVHGVALYKYKNLKITNNVFENYKFDAIREYNGESLSSGQLLIRNNQFIDGGYNAVYFNYYGAKAASYEKIIAIYDNTFKNIGKTINGEDYYAINFNEFNGGSVSISVKYNTFEGCNNAINFNANERTQLHKYLNAYVNYNSFINSNVNYLVNNKLTNTVVNFDNNAILKSDKTSLTNANQYCVGSTNPTTTLISLSELESSVKVYGKNSLNVDAETSFIIEDKTVHWISSNTSVVSIDSKGNAKGLKEGSATLKAYENGNLIAEVDVDVFASLNIDYASLLVTIALGEEGYVEGSNNYTKYGVWYGEKYGKEFQYGAWCAMFVSWCANQANISTDIIPEYASCTAGQGWFTSRNAFGKSGEYTPKTGDIIFFSSNGANSGPTHTGIVVKVENGTVYTIEGNTSNKCAQRKYALGYYTITGYGIPNYPVYTGEKVDFDISSSTDGAGQTTQ